MSTYIDIHILQSYPPSCLNRDDTNQGKTCWYGGVEHSRISSQAIKRPMRLMMEQDATDPAMRTRRLLAVLVDEFVSRGWGEDLAQRAALDVMASLGLKPNPKDDNTTMVMTFLTRSQVVDLVDLAEKHRKDYEGGKAPKNKAPSFVDPKATELIVAEARGTVAMFGRMLTEVRGAQVDGALSVAHAISTHATQTEFDYFTAVDDLQPEGSHGAAHLGDVSLSSSVFYRYASINVSELERNLDGDLETVDQLIAATVNAAILSQPEARKNSTAPFTVPHLVCVTVRTDRPVSLVDAFERPVRVDRDGGYLANSVGAMADRCAGLDRILGTQEVVERVVVSVDEAPESLGRTLESFAEIVDTTVAAVQEAR